MKQNTGKFLLLAFISFLMFRSSQGFQKIAWGTGVWWGEYSLKWGMAYILCIIFCVFVVVLAGFVIWRTEKSRHLFDGMIAIRERSGMARWFLALLVLISPVWFFQYTAWGLVFSDIYIRILIWGLVVFLFAFLIKKGNALPGWNEYLAAALLTSSAFVIAIPFMNVTDFPFSLGWSEGNRMWDYSILFGRHLYDYPADQEIPVLLDIGRQFVGGLPFIVPGLTIEMERFWIALTVLIPYLLLGLAIFRFTRSDLKIWLFGTLWVLIFLKQGPIHPPLVLCAVAVALLWRSPLWLALPLIAITGYIAEQSRFTWVFAPGMWLGMLELAGASLYDKKINLHSWLRAISLGLVGMAGGQIGQKIAGLFAGNVQISPAEMFADIIQVSPAESISSVVTVVAAPPEPLLWYRLLPNETYGVGILLGLLIAIVPLIIVLFYLAKTQKWHLNIWQALAIISPLSAFFVVGLIVSTKIGGGGDLHNMDMFLIGLVFAAVIAWEKGGREWLSNLALAPVWIKLVLLLFFSLPGLTSLADLRPHNFANDVSWLITLTDPPENSSLDMVPPREVSERALAVIQEQVDLALSTGGEVLFMDQRQLLTFGYIKNVPLVPEYEKKILMNEALGSRAAYFEPFYADLAAYRFSLIVSELLRTPIKDSSYQFGEENNAWVKWVSNVVLCYYEPKITLKEVGVQLLAPKAEPLDCSAQLP